MRFAPAMILTFLLFLPLASSLETSTIFSVQPGTGYKCVYVNLPQDLGVDAVSRTSETVIELDKGNSPWTDTTYDKVVINPGVLNRNPVCFYYSDKKEGEFSFYSISLSSRDLDVSNFISGGLCVSNYEDVDTGMEAGNRTDICKLLSENSGIIDLSFSEDVTQAKPGDVVTKTLYITSYASLRIKLAIATNLQNDFGEPVVTTSSSKPTATKTFKVKTPDREGDFEMTVLAQADGCNINACQKQKKSIIYVKQGEKEGISASLIPKDINLKEANEVLFRVIISNHEKSQSFSIEASSDPSLAIDPASKTVDIDQNEEKTTFFRVIPGEEKLYRLDFKVTTENTEKLLTSYLSIGELLTDAMRYSEEAENTASTDIKEEIRKARMAYEEDYNKTSYGDDIRVQEDFLNTIDELKNTSVGNGNQTNPPQQQEGFNWMLLAIPIFIIAAIVLLFVAFKKAKKTDSGYAYPEYSRERELYE